MKKLTLLKFVFIVAAALSLYGQATPKTPVPDACPAICTHLLCGDGEHAVCRNGKCICP
ncbi:MAG TPA: hypothetical protein VIB39_02410 [Candidatus Angelobacter sp.]|jgi:hypothetical protein